MEGAAEFVAAFHSAFREYEFMGSIASAVGHELAEAYSQRVGQLSRAEDIVHGLLEENVAHRRELEAEVVKRQGALEENAREAERVRVAAFEEKEATLRKEADALEARRKELDDRSNLHARRELRQDLKKEIASRGSSFGLTKGTQQKRAPTHALFGLLVLALAAASVEASVLLFRVLAMSPIPTVALVSISVRLTLALAGLVATLVFYIRWTDRWFQKHADEEFKLKRLYLDIDRASWVVEMAHQWAGEKGQELPTDLLRRLSRGLFEEDRPAEPVRHPSEDAARVLSVASGVKLQMPGIGEASLDRKAIKELQREPPRDQEA